MTTTDEIEEHNRKVELAAAARFLCVDCGKDTLDEYYMVSDELWAATGLERFGGMLCLADLEKRIGRPLTLDDFTAVVPSRDAWARHTLRGAV